MSDIAIRQFGPEDEPEVLLLLSLSLGWMPDDHHAQFFDWKHRRNPFGPSWAWVAERDGRVIGFRAFLRWELDRDGETVAAVRAVDTATHPDNRGAGVFSRLTKHGLEVMEQAGVEFVFNTPNEQSRPGYLKMGWRVLGRPRMTFRPASVAVLPRLVTARTPADLWSVATDAGAPAGDVLADRAAVERLLARAERPGGMRTRLDMSYLSWRYGGFPPLCYRATTGRRGIEDGLALFRLRRRGAALEATIANLLVPDGDPRRPAALVREVLRTTRADYAICMGSPAGRGLLPLLGQGPIVTWRPLRPGTPTPDTRTWRITLGDIELL